MDIDVRISTSSFFCKKALNGENGLTAGFFKVWTASYQIYLKYTNEFDTATDCRIVFPKNFIYPTPDAAPCSFRGVKLEKNPIIKGLI